MKITFFKTLVLSIALLSSFDNFSQSVKIEIVAATSIPTAVTTAFQQNFPSVQAYKWEKHTVTGVSGTEGTKYVALFNEKGLVNRARYYTAGTGISVTTYYGTKIPADIAEKAKKVSSKYEGFTLHTGEKVRSLVNAKEVYRIRLRKGVSKLVIYLDAQGNEINKDQLGAEFEDDGIEQ
jgi:hypothetical protein